MAKRPSVQEILEAARRGGPAKPKEDEAAPPAADAAAPADAAPEAEATVVDAAPEAAAASPAPAADVPTPSSLGRPLTLKEKLAAARAGGAARPAAPAPAPKPTPAEPEAAPATPEAASAADAPRAVPPPAPPLGRPLTLQEKLAAARSGGTAPAAGAKPATPAAAKPAAAKPAAARALPPLEELSDPKDLAEAARQAAAKKAKAASAAAAPAKPAAKPETPKAKPVPPKPSRAGASAAATAESGTRRDLLRIPMIAWLVLGWASFVGGVTAFTVMMGRFMFPNVLAEPPSTIKVGLPDQFEMGEVNERWKAEWGFWIVRSDFDGQDVIYALQSVCTHLGCPPNWLAGEQKFKCPCHGSGFYVSGINFEGPAPRPLERFKISLGDDGQLVVDKSQKFQQELGQWADPDSFIPV